MPDPFYKPEEMLETVITDMAWPEGEHNVSILGGNWKGIGEKLIRVNLHNVPVHKLA